MKIGISFLICFLFAGCSLTVTKTNISVKGEGHIVENEVLQEQRAETLQEIKDAVKAEVGGL